MLRKLFITLAILLGFVASTLAQDKARDAVRLSAIYNRTDFPLVRTGGYRVTENVSGYTVEGDVKIFGPGGLRASLAYNFKQAYNVEVFPDYFNGMKMVDLYRNVQTHSGGAQLDYTVKGAIELFGALFYGTRKIHENAPRQIVQTFRFGVNIPFHKKSPFFIKGYLDFDKPYGQLPMGFVNPDTRTLGVGAGFRF